MSSALSFQLWAWFWTLCSELAAVGLWLAIQRAGARPIRHRLALVVLANLWVHPLFWAVHVQIRPYSPAALYWLEAAVVGLEAATYMAVGRIPFYRAVITSLGLNLVSLTVGLYLLV